MTSESVRLAQGPDPGEEPMRGYLVSVSLRGDAADVIARAKAVLRDVVDLPVGAFASGAAVAALPGWFVDACAEEESDEERAAWLQWWRSLDDRARVTAADERPWTVADWLYWMCPDERQWVWWESRVAAADAGVVSVVVDDWPEAIGSLLWLLRASGGVDLVVEGVA